MGQKGALSSNLPGPRQKITLRGGKADVGVLCGIILFHTHIATGLSRSFQERTLGVTYFIQIKFAIDMMTDTGNTASIRLGPK